MSRKSRKILHDIKWAQHFLRATISAFKVNQNNIHLEVVKQYWQRSVKYWYYIILHIPWYCIYVYETSFQSKKGDRIIHVAGSPRSWSWPWWKYDKLTQPISDREMGSCYASTCIFTWWTTQMKISLYTLTMIQYW